MDQDQCAGSRTDGTSGAMGRGVAESHDQSRAAYRIYSRTERVELSTWDMRERQNGPTITIGRSYVFKDDCLYL